METRKWTRTETRLPEWTLCGFSLEDLLPLRHACDSLLMSPKDLLLVALGIREAKLQQQLDAVKAEIKRL